MPPGGVPWHDDRYLERQAGSGDAMTTDVLRDVLEATGYLANGDPAHGVYLDGGARSRCHSRDFAPDALWRSDSALTVYFKRVPETPSHDQVAGWRREIWNQGFAPLLWVVSPQWVYLYNGFGRPLATRDTDANLLRRFRTIEGALDELDAFAGRLAMETGRFWQVAGTVDRKTSVDRQLLSDLSALERDLVAAGQDRTEAQGLIGRSIFTQYLLDRHIVTQQFLEMEYGHGTLAAVLRDRPATERLFDWLRRTFNGDLFPSEGPAVPDAEYLDRAADFLDAVDPQSGQMTLFPYQFDVIPVELISSIYEQFAHADLVTDGPGTDVFYTRLSLVSLVLDEITDGLTGNETVLDLTCGSGVFLVEALRRLVALRANGGTPSREVIRTTLHRQIHGVDVSEAAVRVAAFSLYLAALELDPRPRPPKALRFAPLIGKTLIVGDAWDRDILPKAKKFDLIVGNPPWSYRGKATTAARRLRRSGHKAPRGESLDFVFRAMDFASDDTRFGVILSAVQFFSRSKTGAAASRQLIAALAPVTLVNLSNQSNWLFPRSKMPAVALLARHRTSPRDTITVVQVPWSPAGEKSHTFEIAPSDIITLRLADWERKDELLKGAFCGYRRDLALLDRLTANHRTLGDQLTRLNTELCRGLTVGDQSRDAHMLRGLPLLAAQNFRSFSLPDDLSTFDATGAERPRDRDCYRAPLLIVKEFLRSDARPVVAVADRDTVFTEAYFGSALPSARLETACLIAAILSSSLVSWFFLMTASTFGLWMRRLMRPDIERVPTPDLDAALHSDAGRRLTRLVRTLRRRPPGDADWGALDEAVFDLYGIDGADRIVARDGLFRASWQWARGRSASVEAADISCLADYANVFRGALEVWLSGSTRHHLHAEVFDFPSHTPLRVVRFVLGKKPGAAETVVTKADGALKDVLGRIGQRLDVAIGSFLIGQRELRMYGADEVVIIKPAARRHWMGVSALEDADAVVAETLTGTGA